MLLTESPLPLPPSAKTARGFEVVGKVAVTPVEGVKRDRPPLSPCAAYQTFPAVSIATPRPSPPSDTQDPAAPLAVRLVRLLVPACPLAIQRLPLISSAMS